jgi:dienelactone hydrolase
LSETAGMNAALAHLHAEGIDASNVGVVGFCMGGTIAPIAATERPTGAAVTFYRGGVAAGGDDAWRRTLAWLTAQLGMSVS